MQRREPQIWPARCQWYLRNGALEPSLKRTSPKVEVRDGQWQCGQPPSVLQHWECTQADWWFSVRFARSVCEMIREAIPSDIPRLHELVAEFAQYSGIAGELTSTEADLRSDLFNDRSAVRTWVAEINGVVVGYVIWSLKYRTRSAEHSIYINELMVSAEHRSKGVGKAFVTALARECVVRGHARVEWDAYVDNDLALGFYDAIGACRRHEKVALELKGDALGSLAE